MSRSLDKEQLIETALNTVADREQAYEEACIADAEAETAYRIAKSKAYLTANGSIQAREATALVETENLLRDRNNKRAVKEFTKEKLRDAQSAVSARQSLLNAALRTNEAF